MSHTREEIIKAKCPKLAFEYCKNASLSDDYKVSDNADMRQIIVDSHDPEWAYRYSHELNEHFDMRHVVLHSCTPKWALLWYLNVNKDCSMTENFLPIGISRCIDIAGVTLDEVRQFIIKEQDLDLALWYAEEFKDDDEINQVIQTKDLF